MRRLAGEAGLLALALGFLTRLPVPAPDYAPARMALSLRWYPVAGALIGAIAALVWWLAATVLPPALAALLAVAAAILVTGALHEDGLADTFDGLGSGAARERALEIMRDSRIGTFGTLALGVTVATQTLALASLPGAGVPLALVASHGASRAAMVTAVAAGRYARAEGAAGAVGAGPGPGGLAFALACAAALLLALGLVLPPAAILGGLAGLIAGAGAIDLWARRRLGGYTGDTLGATQQAGATGLLLGLVACL